MALRSQGMTEFRISTIKSYIVPNLREMKEIITIPSYEDFRADDQAIARSESAYEKFYEQRWDCRVWISENTMLSLQVLEHLCTERSKPITTTP